MHTVNQTEDLAAYTHFDTKKLVVKKLFSENDLPCVLRVMLSISALTTKTSSVNNIFLHEALMHKK